MVIYLFQGFIMSVVTTADGDFWDSARNLHAAFPLPWIGTAVPSVPGQDISDRRPEAILIARGYEASTPPVQRSR